MSYALHAAVTPRAAYCFADCRSPIAVAAARLRSLQRIAPISRPSTFSTQVVQVLNAMPGELMVKMVRECVADAWLVDGTLEELQARPRPCLWPGCSPRSGRHSGTHACASQDLLDTEGVRSVDLQGCEVRGRQGKVLHMRRPGLTLRDGTLDLRGGVVRCWFRSGRGGDEWVGLLVQGDGCRLEGVAVTGVREPGVGVAFQNARGCVAEGCRVASTAGTGIWVVGERSTLVATDCEVVDNGGRGVTVSDGATAVRPWASSVAARACGLTFMLPHWLLRIG